MLKTTVALKTPEQVRSEFDRQGMSIAEFARQHGLPASIVYQVLDGQKKGRRGQSHRAAVLLGLKMGDASPATGRQ